MKKVYFLLIIIVFGLNAIAQTAISDIQGKTDASPYAGQSASIKGIVTASSESAAGYFIQDKAEAWSGIYVYDPKRSPKPAPGDEILISGAISEYYDLTEISDLTSFEILSSGNTLPEPIEILTGDDLEQYEGVLVKITGAICTEVSLGYGEWEVNDGSGALVINDFFYEFTPTAGVSYDVVGPMDYSFEAYKIEPRNADDITINAPVYFTVDPYQKNLSKQEITIAWETNSESNSILQYGKTEALEMGEIRVDDLSMSHEITIRGLEAGELYFVKAFSVLESDSTPSNLKSFTTISNSSGKTNVCFTQPNYLFLVGSQDNNTQLKSTTFTIADTIVSYINKAKSTLDIAIYDVINHAPQSDNTNQKIFDAIKEKASSGVMVRLITDDQSTDAFFTELMENANVMWGNTDAIMHHKFLIIDADSEMESWVVTGSTNWTYNNLVMDANNLIAIQDRSLAKAYTVEFNEMWGGSQEAPDYSKGKFGAQKQNNTPHLFEINGKSVELYFSPSDKTESKIIEAIQSADYEIKFSMMAFTSDRIGAALIEAHNRGVEIQGVIDYVEYSGSEYEPLQNAGIAVKDYVNPSGLSWPDDITIHHKFMTVDARHMDSDPLLVTGTHNWSASAESRNDENTLFIHIPYIVQMYSDEAENVFFAADGQGNAVNSFPTDEFNIFPIPANETLNVSSKSQLKSVCIFDTMGKKVLLEKHIDKNECQINIGELKQGFYVLQVQTLNGKNIVSSFLKY